MIFTFYSYKGGVGRTMALANVAELLYQRGIKVLMVDFDLEAPGLERFFDVPEVLYQPHEVIEQQGVIDLLLSYKELRSLPLPTLKSENTSEEIESEETEPEDIFPFPVEPITNFIVPLYEENEQGGSLFIIPAGCRGEKKFSEYAQKVHSFNWNDFFDNYNGEDFFEWFRKEVINFADVVLIDSRTGVTEMGGVCTYQLADVVVMFVAPNDQNIDGTFKMAQSLSNPDLIEKGRKGRDLSLVIIPSRVDNGEKELLDKFQVEFNRKLTPFISRKLTFKRSAFIDLKIPYVPFYAYKEKVAVRESTKASASDLTEAFESLINIIPIFDKDIIFEQEVTSNFTDEPLDIVESDKSDEPNQLSYSIDILDSTDTFNDVKILKTTNKKRKFLYRLLLSFINYIPLGASGYILVSFLLQQEWILSILTFAVTITALIWTFYSESVLTRFSEICAERYESLKWQLAGVDQKYLKLQANACTYYKTEGYTLSNIFVPLLNEVFIPLELSNHFYLNSQGEYLPLTQGFQWDKQTIELIERKGLTIWDVLKQADKYPAFKRLAVIAWGGYGKTTLLRHITYIYTSQKGKYKNYRGKQKKAPDLLPVLITLRDWQTIIINNNNQENETNNNQKTKLDLPTLIEKYHIPNLPESEGFKLPTNWAKNHLKQGKMLVMFDGFDEVQETCRYQVSLWLGKEMRIYKDSIFILTSRPYAYQDFLTEYKLNTELFIKPFNRPQQSRFIHNWYWCQEKYIRVGRDTPDVKAEAEKNAYNLLEQLEKRPELDDLAKNPLLLNIITTLHRSYSGAELPKRRTDLYREVINLQLGNRPLARQIQLLLPSEEAQKVLQKLALYMVQEHKPAVNYNLLLSCLVRYSVESFDNFVNIEQFIEQIIDVSELLVKRDEYYQFSHLSFQHYLASKEIIETEQDNLLIDNWDKSWWRETILLYSAQVNPNNLLRQLIDIRSDEALKLAKLCIQETLRKIDDDVTKSLHKAEKELENIENQFHSLLFQKLEEYLKNEQWREADKETDRLMLQLGDKDEKGYLNTDDCKNFPQEELRTIDRLWLDYSNGKFGFSVQKEIYLQVGGKLNHYDHDSYKKMGDRLGWRKNNEWLSYSNLTFNNKTAPQGHLPTYKHNLSSSKIDDYPSIIILLKYL